MLPAPSRILIVAIPIADPDDTTCADPSRFASVQVVAVAKHTLTVPTPTGPLEFATDASTVRTLPGYMPEPRGAGGAIAIVVVVETANAAVVQREAADKHASQPIVLIRLDLTMEPVEDFTGSS